MGGTYAGTGLASYRDTVTGLMQSGQPFGAVEDAIDKSAGLTEDAKAALWLLAFSMPAPGDQSPGASADVAALA